MSNSQLISVVKQLKDIANQLESLVNSNDTSAANLTSGVRVQESDFEELVKLLNSSDWPVAVDPSLICDLNNEEDKKERASGVIDLINETLVNKKFLDFGCGEGHIIDLVKSKKTSFALGYDPVKHDNWIGTDYTDDLKMVTENGPYDVIVLFDV